MLAISLRNETLYRRSIIDDLTGVASRGHFDARLSQEINRITTYGHRNMGLLMLDIDDFKFFNDRYGHQTGDRVLQELARLLVRQVRTVDLVARYGGEEFAVILLEIDRAKVLEVAERLCASVAQMEVPSGQGEALHITASFGLACFPDDALDKSTLIELADEAMYRSKALGKNRVTATEPGAGKKRTTLAPRPTGSALHQPALIAPEPSETAGQPQPTRRRPGRATSSTSGDWLTLSDQGREIGGYDSSSSLGATAESKKERRGFPPPPPAKE
jgi:diguanylate cyclase (GGDEF)-like protein